MSEVSCLGRCSYYSTAALQSPKGHQLYVPFEPRPVRFLSRLALVGISFISIFIIVYNIFFWVCGLARSLAWDYAPGVPQGEEAQRRVPWREKPIGSLVHRHLFVNSPLQPPAVSAPQVKVNGTSEADTPTNIEKEKSTSVQVTVSSQSDNGPTLLPVHVHSASSTTGSLSKPRFRQFLQTLSMVFTPINLVIGVSLCISLVQPLKALFVDVSVEGGPSWKGPDGKPPLAFIIDTGSLLTLGHTVSLAKLIPFFITNSLLHRCNLNPTLSRAPRFLLREDENPSTDLSFANSRNHFRLRRKDGIVADHWHPRCTGHGQEWSYPTTKQGADLCGDVPERYSHLYHVRVQFHR